MKRHEVARNRAHELSGESWAPLEPMLPTRIAERMMKRVISMLRDARHGGTFIFVPEENTEDLSTKDPYIDLKYRFPDGPQQLYFTDLVVDILNRLAQLYGASDKHGRGPVGWREFEATTDDEIAMLDEALFETAHLIAGLGAADVAVVFSKHHHKLLGFGGMISGRLVAVRSVARALDLEGEKIVEEETGNVSGSPPVGLPTGRCPARSGGDCDLPGQGRALHMQKRRARYLLGARVNRPLSIEEIGTQRGQVLRTVILHHYQTKGNQS